MKIIVCDTETNALRDSTTMWLFGGKNLATGEVTRFEPFRGQDQIEAAIEWSSDVDLWIGHNFLEFDLIEIHRHIKPRLIDPTKVLDTLIVSRLIKYDINPPKGSSKPHSLDAWGRRLGLYKGDFTDFENYSQEMVDYWEQDLEVTEALYNRFKRYIDDPSWQKAIRVEHDVQIELTRQQHYGFAFDKAKAEGILSSVKQKMETLEAEIQEDYPPKLKPTNTIQYRKTKQGEEYASVKKAREKYALVDVQGDEMICYEYVPFKPGSPKDRIEALWDAGWKPFEKTKTHQKFSRKRVGDPYGKSVKSMSQEFYDKKKEHLEYYGWAVNEDNLKTLPDKAPAGAKKLAQWLTLEGRRSSLVEWIGQVKDDGRIHGRTQHIGAWTGRGAHKSPNTANISSVWPANKTARSPVEEIKKEFDTSMRACWIVPEDNWMVGVDADGIQLRILGDQLWRHFGERSYADTIEAGRKEDETDIHNVNKRALSLNHLTRDDAKTFIYAWVLNAGIPKLASILRTNVPSASTAKDNFEKSIPGLKPFKESFLPAVADNKWFTGYDGRKVIVPSLHKTLAGILQNGEAVVMKHAQIRWNRQLRADGIRYKPLSWVHDEWQTEVIGTRDEAEHVKEVQKKAIVDTGVELGFKIPLAGSGSIGKNWSETH